MKVAFITRGAFGIGEATVALFLQRGMQTAFLDQDRARGEEVAARYPGSLFLWSDVRSLAAQKKAVAATLAHFGRLDILFANAGIHQSKTLLETEETELDDLIDVYIKGVFFTLQAGLPALIAQGGGAAVLMGSDQSMSPKKGCSAYGLAKGAIVQLAKSTALDYASFNIRVNAIYPGTIWTPLAERALKGLVSGQEYPQMIATEEALYPLVALEHRLKLQKPSIF